MRIVQYIDIKVQYIDTYRYILTLCQYTHCITYSQKIDYMPINIDIYRYDYTSMSDRLCFIYCMPGTCAIYLPPAYDRHTPLCARHVMDMIAFRKPIFDTYRHLGQKETPPQAVKPPMPTIRAMGGIFSPMRNA